MTDSNSYGTSGKTSTVFLGSADNMIAMTEAGVYTAMLADGVSLYGHLNGVYALVASGQMSQLTDIWSSADTAPGVAEFGWNSDYASGSVTVQNTSSTTLTITVGDIYTASNGEKYQVLSDPGQPGYVEGESGANTNGYVSTESGGYYQLAAGTSLTLRLEAEDNTTAGNADADAITSLSGANSDSFTVTSSTAFTNGGSDSNNVFEGGENAPIYYLYQKYGFMPSEGDVNVADSYQWTGNDVTSWKSYVDATRATGVMNVAPILSFNGLNADYSQDFATSPYWATMREAALYGGGIAFDTPAGFFNQFTQNWFPLSGENPLTYDNWIESEIKWANSEGLRSSIIIAPFGDGMTDTVETDYLEQVKAMVATLKAAGALPSEFIIENYNLDTKSNTFDASSADTESLNAVAAYLSTVATVTTNSESGLEVIGQSAADMVMTGIKPSVTVGWDNPTLIYDAPSIFASSADTKITMTITSSVAGLTLAATGATVSSDGLTLTATGTESQLTAVLQSLTIADGAQSMTGGSDTLGLSFSDGTSSISGKTTVSYAASATWNATAIAGQVIDYVASASNTSAGFIGNGGGLKDLAPVTSTIVGTFSSLDVEGVGSASTMALELTGQGSVFDYSGQAGITLDAGGSLSLVNAAANVYSEGGDVFTSGSQPVDITGTLNYATLSGNVSASVALNGAATLDNGDGTFGITVQNGAYLNVENSTAYVTLVSGNVDVNAANVHLSSVAATNPGSFVNVNAGSLLDYTANSGSNLTVFGNAGWETVTLEQGYTTVDSDMTGGNFVAISGMTAANAGVYATHLNATGDLNVTYADGNALVTEEGQSGGILLEDTSAASYYAGFGDTDFTTTMGSTSDIITRDAVSNVDDITSDIQATIEAGATARVTGGTSVLDGAAGHINFDMDMTSGAHLEIENFTGTDMLFIRGMSASDVKFSFIDGNANITGANGSSLIIDNISQGSLSAMSALDGVSTNLLTGATSSAVLMTQ